MSHNAHSGEASGEISLDYGIDVTNGTSAGYPVELAVASMLCCLYSFGEGHIGRVASTGKHCWIFADEFESKLPPETILLVPVIPHGVVHLGSLHKIPTNFQYRWSNEQDNCRGRGRGRGLVLSISSASSSYPKSVICNRSTSSYVTSVQAKSATASSGSSSRNTAGTSWGNQSGSFPDLIERGPLDTSMSDFPPVCATIKNNLPASTKLKVEVFQTANKSLVGRIRSALTRTSTLLSETCL